MTEKYWLEKPLLPPIDPNAEYKRQATEALRSHSKHFSGDWHPSDGENINGRSFYRQSIKRSRAVDCYFDTVDYTRSAGMGSFFVGCIFDDCRFDQCNFQFCDFSGAKFVGKSIFSGANFSGSIFNSCKISGASIIASSFTDCDFAGVGFDDCIIESCSFEGSVFPGALLSKIDLANTNVEYADFNDAKLQEVKISLAQFSYVFGITVSDIQKGNVRISTSNKSYKDRYLPWSDLVLLVPNIITHYRESKEYFPLANLLFMSGYVDELRNAIEAGLRSNGLTKRYRELKYLAKLARFSEIYDGDELQNLYDLVLITQSTASMKERHAFSMHDGALRKHLLTGDEHIGLHISMRVTPLEGAPGNLLPWLLEMLFQGCALQGVELRWDYINSTISSPGHLRGRVRLPKAEHERVRRERISLILNALGVLFGAISASQVFVSQEKAELERLRLEIRRTVVIQNFNGNFDGENIVRLGGDGQYVWSKDFQNRLLTHE